MTVNLTKLFEMQKALDERIIKEKNLEEMNRLPYLILALQVELGETANSWRGFKFWSTNREPNPDLLEEYVDCLHFILSIGLLIGASHDYDYSQIGLWNFNTITESFISLGYSVARLAVDMGGNDPVTQKNYLASPAGKNNNTLTHRNYKILFSEFIKLGEMLGFTWEQIEQAYISKNEVNHNRQATGY